jgi:hypothetical protein
MGPLGEPSDRVSDRGPTERQAVFYFDGLSDSGLLPDSQLVTLN